MKHFIYAASCVIDRVQTGKNIRRFRQSRGLSVMDVSELFGGLARNSIYKWERGDTLPSIDNLYSLAWVFGVSLDELVAGNRASLDRGDNQLVELYPPFLHLLSGRYARSHICFFVVTY